MTEKDDQSILDEYRIRARNQPVPAQIPAEKLDASLRETCTREVSNSNEIMGNDKYKNLSILLMKHLKERGYCVVPEYTLHHIARVDLYAFNNSERLFIEIKDGSEADNHSLLVGVGQLLFYHYLDPKPKLALATPARNSTRHRMLTKIHRSFLKRYHIQLLEVDIDE